MTPPAARPDARRLSPDAIQQVVLQAMQAANLARHRDAQLVVAPEAAIFGPGSPLDSLGLVALLLDIEDGLQAAGSTVVLSDDRAVSRQRSPFRSAASLVAYIGELTAA